jgi:tryptophanyl-tRNA synthetase
LKALTEKPEALNLITIYASLTGLPLNQALDEVKGKEYSYLKNKLSDALVEVICPVGKEIKKLLEDKSFLEKTLKEGTEKAREIAEHNLKEIRNVVGFF